MSFSRHSESVWTMEDVADRHVRTGLRREPGNIPVSARDLGVLGEV